MDKQTFIIERYRREVYRIGWRLQYQTKKIRRHEACLFDVTFIQQESSDLTHTRMWIRQGLSTLPEKGRTILDRLYIQDLTEAEVAMQLHISQQAVSKWKKKMLQQLSQTMNL